MLNGAWSEIELSPAQEGAMRKRFIVDLTHEELASLAGLLRKGVAPARKLTRARILLLANEGGSDQAIAAALHVHPATVERTRRRFVEGNLERALTEKPRPGGRAKLDGRRHSSSLWPAAKRLKDAAAGPCSSWPTSSLNSRSLRRSATRRCDAR